MHEKKSTPWVSVIPLDHSKGLGENDAVLCKNMISAAKKADVKRVVHVGSYTVSYNLPGLASRFAPTKESLETQIQDTLL